MTSQLSRERTVAAFGAVSPSPTPNTQKWDSGVILCRVNHAYFLDTPDWTRHDHLIQVEPIRVFLLKT